MAEVLSPLVPEGLEAEARRSAGRCPTEAIVVSDTAFEEA
jgi:ferredoxin